MISLTHKLFLCAVLLACTSVPVFGADKSPQLPPLEDIYFGGTGSSALTPQEREGLNISKKWQEGGTLKPVQGPDGSVRFLFGATQPSIVCAVMQVTDIELEPGEVINTMHMGDTARWLMEPAITGAGVAEVQHLIIKPMDVGLETSLVITTNRRTYHCRLKSHRSQYMPKVSFVYPDAVMARWQAQKSQQTEQQKTRTLPETGEYLDNLDFGYRIEGNVSWKPVRVYNDGKKTIIQMPPNVRESPTLLLINNGETVMANYRLQGNRYIVDDLFDKAILIAGVGSKQAKVTIIKGK